MSQSRIHIYTTTWCGYCHRAKALLDRKKLEYDETDVDGDLEKRRWLADVTGQNTVPQVFIDGEPIGGCDELHELEASGDLDRRLGRS